MNLNNSITTSGAQTYAGAVTMGGDATLTAGNNVTFSSTLNGAHNLVVNATGTTMFGGAVGGNQALASITVDPSGNTNIDTSTMTTTGAQAYNNAVTLTASGATSFTTSNNNITFDNTVDGPSGMSFAAGTGLVDFVGAIGATTAPSSIASTGSGTVTFGGAVGTSSNLVGSINIAGASNINGGSVYTSGDQTYSGAVTINSDTALYGANLNLASINGSSGQNLTFNTSGTSSVSGIIGSNINNLALNSTSGYNGSLTLDAVNSYAGSTTISSGTLYNGINNALPMGAALVDNSMFDLNNYSQQVASITGSGIVTNSGATLGTFTINNSSTDTFNSVFSGNLALAKTNSGTLNLGGANTYSGATLVSGGELNLTVANAMNNTSGITVTNASRVLFSFNGTFGNSNQITLDTNSTARALDFNSGVTVLMNNPIFLQTNSIIGSNGSSPTLAGQITGSGNLTDNGTLTITLSNNNNTFSGSTTIQGGTLELTNAGALNGTSGITVNSGATLYLNFSSSATLGNTNTITLNGTGNGGIGALSLSNAIVNSPIALASNSTIAGTGTLEDTANGGISGSANVTFGFGSSDIILTGTNTYTGSTTVAGNSILALNSAGALGNGTNNTSSVTVNSGAELDMGGVTLTATPALSIAGSGTNAALYATSGTSSYGGAITMTGNSTIAAASGATLNLTNTIDSQVGHNYALTLQGPGAIQLSGAIGSGTALSSISGSSNLSLTLSDGSITTVGTQTYNGAVILGATDTFTTTNSAITFGSTLDGAVDASFAAGNAAVNFNGAIGSNNAPTSIISTGTGTVTFGGAVGTASKLVGSINITGATNINGGSVYTSGDQTYSGAVVINSDTSLFGTNLSLASINGTSGQNLNLNTSGTSSVAGIIGSNIINLALNNTAGYTGILTLDSANTYTGTTTINAGTIADGINNALPVGTALTDNGTLDLNGFAQQVASVAGSGVVTNSSGTANTFTINNSGADTFAGSITQNIALTKSAGGALTLNSANTYTGATTISAGSILNGINNALPTGTVLSDSGTLNLNGFTQQVASLTGSGVVTNSGSTNTFTINNSGSDSFAGSITQNIALVKSAAGTLTLGSANSYTGPTTISAGTIADGVTNALPTTTALSVSGALDLNGSSQQVASVTGSGNVTDSGAAAAFTVNNSSADSFAGTLTGNNLSLIAAGSATLTLTNGSNTYGGATTINSGGTIANGIANALPTGTSLIDNGTLDVQGFSQQVANATGSGVITDSGAAATFTINNGSTDTFAGTITGSNLALTAAGTATLTLTNSGNSYGGITTINNSSTIADGINNALPINTSLSDSGTLDLSNFTNK